MAREVQAGEPGPHHREGLASGDRMTVEKLRAESREKINEVNARIAVIERDDSLCICGREAADVHHILGRSDCKGWKNLPEPLKSAWPHVPMNMICLCKAGHRWAHDATRHSRPLLLAYLWAAFGDKIWEGKTIREWLSRPPFRAFLFGEGGTR